MKAIIIDDEKGSRNNLKFLLERFCPQVEIAGWAEDAKTGLALIAAERPDLVFLDIEMPEQDGFQMISQLPSSNRPHIVFTTAYEQYAIKAFKVAAADYLLKPIDIDELKHTVERIAKQRTTALKESLHNAKEENLKKLVIPHQTGLTFLEESEIICLEASRNYTEIHIQPNKKLLVAKTLGDFEGLLTSGSFFRAHRSFIINLHCLEQWVNKEGGYLLMNNQLRVPLARNRRERFFQLIETLK